MPDPVVIMTAMGVATVAAAALILICSWPWRSDRLSWFDAGWVLGVGAGFFLGCWMLGIRPHWPPREDQDRLLALVLPAILVVEVLAATHQTPRWLTLPLRAAVAASTPGILLYGSSYLSDVGGPATREWSPLQAWLILSALAAALAVAWALLTHLAHRAPGLSQAVCLSGTAAGSALAVMLSGYATGGQIGLPLAAAVLGAAAAALVLPRTARTTGAIGVIVASLFSLLVIGHFFGELTTAHAILLFVAPLLGWLPELSYVRRLPRWARGLARVILVAIAVLGVVTSAQLKFVEASSKGSGYELPDPTVQDDSALQR
jgi:hypothetical protein